VAAIARSVADWLENHEVNRGVVIRLDRHGAYKVRMIFKIMTALDVLVDNGRAG
jgi:hypothetical protein